MNRRSISYLLVLTAAVAALLWVFQDNQNQTTDLSGGLFIPGLADKVNDMDHLVLTAGGGKIIANLERAEQHWVVREAGGYPADWKKIRTLLASLAQAIVIEPKTAKPEWYSRLGVEPINEANAGGVLVTFSETSGVKPVILGHEASNREGQYARIQSVSGSVLVDQVFDVPRVQAEWLDTAIVDIADAEVVEARIIHADGDELLILKVSAEDSDFVLQGAPDGREVKSNWSVNSLAGGLSALTLDAVEPAKEFKAEHILTYQIVTADGLALEARYFLRGDDEDLQYWMRLAASTWGLETVAETAERAAAINERVSEWAYRVPRFKLEALNKRMEDLLAEVEEI